MNVRRWALSGLVCGVALVATLDAHHSAAAYYNIKKTVTITGTVSKVQWRNPHVFFYVDVKDKSGGVSTWSLETQSPEALNRLGFRKDDVKPGDLVTVDLMPAISSPSRGRIRVLKANGKSFVDLALGGADAAR